ncbi:class I SAM-dependent DNA methyltransferase [Streptosporangium sp. NPDC023963]|uniref:class I SAM-dependent DNA methyltransferase n=1 Tax=Streptosporangium sp. NPDC023963 TaxID=3155608 RepID=UPI003445A2AE
MSFGRDQENFEASALVRRLWQYCNILRDDGLSYPDYVEQLTYLLFLKMSDEQTNGPVPKKHSWSSFAALEPKAMHRKYGETLSALSGTSGMLGLIFSNARNKIKDPAKLRLLVSGLIGQTSWTGLSADLKGDAYEGLLEKNARDTKSGAGQYFTPRALVRAIVECVNPRLGEVVADPACGTAGFLLAAHQYLKEHNPHLTPAETEHLNKKAIRGGELVEEVARLAGMNLLLHGISGSSDADLPIVCGDSLEKIPDTKVDIVLTNPPFGVKGSITYSAKEKRSGDNNDDLTVFRSDFWVPTANKQLNFVQHVYMMLKSGGRAALVLPDNVLFEGGAAALIRRKLMELCDVHTILRLPPGLFYAHGVKSNVVFFDVLNRREQPKGSLWVYDLRTDVRFSLRSKPIQESDLLEFVDLYQAGQLEKRQEHEGLIRWRRFSHEEILSSQDCSWHFSWSASPEASTPPMQRLSEISQLIEKDLMRALESVRNAVEDL